MPLATLRVFCQRANGISRAFDAYTVKLINTSLSCTLSVSPRHAEPSNSKTRSRRSTCATANKLVLISLLASTNKSGIDALTTKGTRTIGSVEFGSVGSVPLLRSARFETPSKSESKPM